jgi:hypothetical protein
MWPHYFRDALYVPSFDRIDFFLYFFHEYIPSTRLYMSCEIETRLDKCELSEKELLYGRVYFDPSTWVFISAPFNVYEPSTGEPSHSAQHIGCLTETFPLISIFPHQERLSCPHAAQ